MKELILNKPLAKGDLVYIPSSVRLEAEGLDNVPKKIYTTEKPLHYLVVEKTNNDWLRVYHKGSTWRGRYGDVYEVRS